MYGFHIRSPQSCQGVQGITCSRDFGSVRHHWFTRRGSRVGGRSQRAMADAPSLHETAWINPCHIHGRKAPENCRCRFYESRVVLRQAAHRCGSIAIRDKTNAQELTNKLLKLRATVEFLDVRPPTRIAGRAMVYKSSYSCLSVHAYQYSEQVVGREFSSGSLSNTTKIVKSTAQFPCQSMRHGAHV